jgi:mannose-6-phosphate isomerase-like protein (cupin superfamily)
MNEPARYHVTHFSEIAPTSCPCGSAQRAFAEIAGAPASVHLVDIKDEAETHYHKSMTEIYVVLEGEGHLELDGERVPVRPMSAVMILPGCRHRAVGRLKILNIPVPAFDPEDEWFD